jgi:hypothetical protein
MNVPAAIVEARVVEHLADHATPPELVAEMRDELGRLRHIPDEGLRAQRGRRKQALARLRDAFVWGHIAEIDYHAQRRPIEAELANLPRPEDANVIAFDRTAGRLLPLADVLHGATPEHHARIVSHIVERVVIEGRDVLEMRVRFEARPFFAEIENGMAVAPPDGLRPPTATQRPGLVSRGRLRSRSPTRSQPKLDLVGASGLAHPIPTSVSTSSGSCRIGQ